MFDWTSNSIINPTTQRHCVGVADTGCRLDVKEVLVPVHLQVPAGQRSTLGWLRTWSGCYSRGRCCGQPTAMQIIHVKSTQCIKGARASPIPLFLPFQPIATHRNQPSRRLSVGYRVYACERRPHVVSVVIYDYRHLRATPAWFPLGCGCGFPMLSHRREGHFWGRSSTLYGY